MFWCYMYSDRPSNLLRILVIPENNCNFHCSYCCFWDGKSLPKKSYTPDASLYSFLVRGAVESGCNRFMLTGGEPLLLNSEYLYNVVSNISSVEGVRRFWINTNGSLLVPEVSRKLVQNGLSEVVVSLSADTREVFSNYTTVLSEVFETVVDNIASAVDAGIFVRIAVPLFRGGISTIDQFLGLISLLSDVGVRSVGYFGLHMTEENKDVFDDLYVDPNIITQGLLKNNDWSLTLADDGKKTFFNGKMQIIIPTIQSGKSNNCLKNNCGKYCQGEYAAYLCFYGEKIYIRSCHREFDDRRNEFFIDNEIIAERKMIDLARVYSSAWSYTK